MTTQIKTENTGLPDSFFSLFAQICRGFLRNFSKNMLKAFFATAFAIFLPEFLAWVERLDLIDNRILKLLYEFAISPQNMLRGCLLSSLLIITGFSLFEKIWLLGMVKSIGHFLTSAFSWLNLIRNSKSTAFPWGIVIGFSLGCLFENTILSLSLFSATFLAGIIPERSGLIYFARFFRNRFFESQIQVDGLKPSDELIRGISPGILIGTYYKTQNADATMFAAFAAAVFLLWLIAFFRQKKGA